LLWQGLLRLLPDEKKILFVCIENSNRSQMSQAFAKILGGNEVEAYSAGSKPSGIVNPKAIASMKELGYELSKHNSKSLDEVKAMILAQDPKAFDKKKAPAKKKATVKKTAKKK